MRRVGAPAAVDGRWGRFSSRRQDLGPAGRRKAERNFHGDPLHGCFFPEGTARSPGFGAGFQEWAVLRVRSPPLVSARVASEAPP